MYNAIINMPAISQLAIILSFVTLWKIRFGQMATVSEKGSRLQFWGILRYLKLRFWNYSGKFILFGQLNQSNTFILYCSDWSLCRSQSEEY